MRKLKKKLFILFIVFTIIVSTFITTNIDRICLNYINSNFLNTYNLSSYKEPLLINKQNASLRSEIKRKNKQKISLQNAIRKVVDKTRDADYDIDKFLNLWEDSIPISNLGISITGCKQMVPQGICFAKDYILITQYCKSYKHETILTILDKNTKEYVKTLILQDEYIHAGGITYNPDINQVVIAGSSNEDSSLIYYYDFDVIQKLKDNDYLQINYIKKVPLKETSFISYNEYLKEMYLGYFSLENENGKIFTLDSKNEYEKLDAYMQGCCFYKNYIFLSYSYGLSNSKIVIKKMNKNGSISNEEVYELSCPPYLEEIILDKKSGKLYCLFESGAAPYRGGTNLVIDRIVILDVNDILKTL